MCHCMVPESDETTTLDLDHHHHHDNNHYHYHDHDLDLDLDNDNDNDDHEDLPRLYLLQEDHRRLLLGTPSLLALGSDTPQPLHYHPIPCLESAWMGR